MLSPSYMRPCSAALRIVFALTLVGCVFDPSGATGSGDGGVPDADPGATAEWLEVNRRYSAVWPNMARMGTPPVDADEWNGKPGKAPSLSPKPHEE